MTRRETGWPSVTAGADHSDPPVDGTRTPTAGGPGPWRRGGRQAGAGLDEAAGLPDLASPGAAP